MRAGATDLVLAAPLLGVFDVTSATYVDIPARLDEHVVGGVDIGYGGFAGIVAGDPERNWDVVCRTAEGDGEKAVDAEQKLCAAVIESWGGKRQWGRRCQRDAYCRHRPWDAGWGSGRGRRRRRRRRVRGWGRAVRRRRASAG